MSKNQNGFGLVEILLLIAVTIILGCLSWIFYSNILKEKPSAQVKSVQTTNSTVEPTKPIVTVDPYKTWNDYSGHGFELKYPQNWKQVDAFGDRTDLSEMLFGTQVESNSNPLPSSSFFVVDVYHSGYKICDCDPTTYVNSNTDLITFIRTMNGLIPESNFSQVTEEKTSIDGYTAVKFDGNIITDYYVKIGDNIYGFNYNQGKSDVDSKTLGSYFNLFLTSFKALNTN